ncbi:phosphotransferase [Lactococcus nasutitermitis]|uniref:Phosphotransferase n=1 Tax=Lactococcus nasutitermitis TaxID=1652957 RepID=A0ABV9JI85_9LACT|nr:phosphotransferase [Lactococcus nasutitermitis]
MTEIVEQFIAERFKNQAGEPANPGNIGDPKKLARDLGNFIFSLHKLDTTDAPKPSFENAFAGSDLPLFEAEFTELIKKYEKIVPVDLLDDKFLHATKRPWNKEPLWIHGNLTAKNLRVENGKLVGIAESEKAVIADPACDLAIAWTLFDTKARKIFFAAAEADKSTIERAQIWALINALKAYDSDDIDELIQSRDALTEILKEYDYSNGTDFYDGQN